MGRMARRVHLLEPSVNRLLLQREAGPQGLPIGCLGMRDSELESREPHDVVGIATGGELQRPIGQPLEQAPELTVGPGVRTDTADVMHTGGERPVLPRERLRESACHAVLF